MIQTYDYKKLRRIYDKITARVYAECTFVTELVGGISATPEGVRTFVKYQLGLPGSLEGLSEEDKAARLKEAEDACQRILRDETQYDSKKDPEHEGDLDEKLTYGINTLRRDDIGPWLGDWQIKACIKGCGTRLNLFTTKRQSKGDIAEMGEVRAAGVSAKDQNHPERIYLVNGDGKSAPKTEFKTFKGRVQGPKGSVSIVSDKECAPPGTRFAFEFRLGAGNKSAGKISKDDIAKIFAVAMTVGLGSARAFERGHFRVDKLELEMPNSDSEAA